MVLDRATPITVVDSPWRRKYFVAIMLHIGVTLERSNAFHMSFNFIHGSCRPIAFLTMSLVEDTPKENKAMTFLRKIGKVGGASNKNFINAIGVDEGSVGKSPLVQGRAQKNLRKIKEAYQECTISGIIDDLTEAFPYTSSGTQWIGITDRVMGGASNGIVKREIVGGRLANILTGSVSLANNGGFIQMATDLSIFPERSLTVDASAFHGIEIDVFNDGVLPRQKFNIHLRNTACLRQFSSYRSTFEVPENQLWFTIQIPFASFVGYGPGSSEIPLDKASLRRIGIVAIGEEMNVCLAVGGLRFYK